MKIRGNYLLFYIMEIFAGILLYILLINFGDLGLIGIILFFIGILVIQKKDPDEREIYLIYKTGSYEGVIIGAAMAIIYFKFPEVNWFYSLLCISLIARGVIGYFKFRFS